MPGTHDRIREKVSRSYAEAVQVRREGGCCSTEPADAASPKGVAAKHAGYAAADLQSLPAEVVENSFGCGNPLALAEIRPGEVIVDLGCGAGIDVLLAAKAVGPTGKVIGVDMTDEMIERANASIAKAGITNTEIRKGLIEALPIESGTADRVISNCVINLSPEKDRVFKEIARVLKPGGQVMVADILADDLPDWVLQSDRLYASCISGAVSENQYLGYMRDAGLTDATVVQKATYDGEVLENLLRSEICGCGGEATSCCGADATDAADTVSTESMPSDDMVQRLIAACAGKIHSAKVRATKPVSTACCSATTAVAASAVSAASGSGCCG